MEESALRYGAKRGTRIMAKIRRALRPKHHRTGKSSAPFDWAKGYDCEAKAGKLRIKDQGQSDSCGGQAGSRWLEIALASAPEQSAKAIYSQGFDPEGGMTVASLENVVCSLVSEPESIIPSYDASGSPLDEAQYRDLSWKTPSMARAFQDFIPVTVALDKEAVAEAMRDTGAVIMMIEGQNGNSQSWTGPAPQIPSESNPNGIWTHYMCSKAASASFPKPIAFYQSWGTSVGDGGIQYFGDDYFKSGRVLDVFTFRPKGSIAGQRISLTQRLLVMYQSLLAGAKSHPLLINII